MPTTLRVLALMVTLGVAPWARAEQPQQNKLVSTFPLVLEGQFKKEDASAFEDLIRSEASQNLSPFGYKVLTAETTLKVLEENGVTAEQLTKACESSCALEAAKELKVKLFIAGTVRRIEDGTVSVFIRLFDGETGALLSSTSELQGERLKDVRDAFAKKSKAFFDLALSQISDPAVKAKLAEVHAKEEAEKELERQRELDRASAGNRGSFFPKKNPILDLGGHLVIRGGFGGVTGILGGGAEWHFDHLALAIGFGSYASAGVTIKPLVYGERGGPYLDVHVATALAGTIKDKGVGATVGYDFRPIPWITLKGGLGGAWTTLAKDAPHARPLVLDLSAGLVF